MSWIQLLNVPEHPLKCGITGPSVTKTRFSVRQKPVGPPLARQITAALLKVTRFQLTLPFQLENPNTNARNPHKNVTPRKAM
jgi:hypothetical protein